LVQYNLAHNKPGQTRLAPRSTCLNHELGGPVYLPN